MKIPQKRRTRPPRERTAAVNNCMFSLSRIIGVFFNTAAKIYIKKAKVKTFAKSGTKPNKSSTILA